MNRILLTALFVFSYIVVQAQEDSVKAIDVAASYQGDVMSNTRGGLKTGVSYVGMASVSADIDIGKLGLWKGGEVFAAIACSHGGMPTANFIGDYQGVDGNEFGNYIYLNEAWMRQQLGNVWLKGGIIDLSLDYSNIDAAGNFIGAGYPCNNILQLNGDAAVNPSAGLSFDFGWNISKHLSWQVGLFDGNVRTLTENNPHNLKHSLTDGVAIITQLSLHNDNSYLQIGGFRNTCLDNYGAYITAQSRVWNSADHSLDVFGSFGFIPDNQSNITRNIIAGVVFNGLLLNDHGDMVGLGMTSAKFLDESWETNIEMYYNIPFLNYFYIQPDIEYIINPRASHELKNSFMCNLRFGFNI